jgi:hypothetical protein
METMLFKNGRYANVASTLALIVALGGTSYAAVAIPKNSVGSPQIINSSVKSKDVKNGTLKKVDFKASELPVGPQGPAGPAGPAGAQGPIGPSNGYSVDSGTNVLAWTGAEQTVSTLNVPAGNYVLFANVLGNNNTAAVASLNCKLRLNGVVIDSGFDSVDVDSSAADLDRAYIPLGGAATAAAATTATVTCTSSQASGNWLNRVITAIKVGSIG